LSAKQSGCRYEEVSDSDLYGLPGAVAYGGEGRLDGVGGADVDPVFGREVVESEQHLLIFSQTLAGFGVFGLVAFEKCVILNPAVGNCFSWMGLHKNEGSPGG